MKNYSEVWCSLIYETSTEAKWRGGMPMNLPEFQVFLYLRLVFNNDTLQEQG